MTKLQWEEHYHRFMNLIYRTWQPISVESWEHNRKLLLESIKNVDELTEAYKMENTKK